MLRSCSKGDTAIPGSEVKFTNLQILNGIRNVSGFVNSGIFTCESPGVYLFSYCFSSNTLDTGNLMLKNKQIIGNIPLMQKIFRSNSSNNYIGVNSVPVILATKNELSVIAYGLKVYTYRPESCITIIKIG